MGERRRKGRHEHEHLPLWIPLRTWRNPCLLHTNRILWEIYGKLWERKKYDGMNKKDLFLWSSFIIVNTSYHLSLSISFIIYHHRQKYSLSLSIIHTRQKLIRQVPSKRPHEWIKIRTVISCNPPFLPSWSQVLAMRPPRLHCPPTRGTCIIDRFKLFLVSQVLSNFARCDALRYLYYLWFGFSTAMSSWIELNWIELNWIELDWIETNWIELNPRGLEVGLEWV